MRKYLKVGEVAELCGCCEKTVRRFVDKGLVRATRNYKNYRLISLQEALKLQKLLTGAIQR